MGGRWSRYYRLVLPHVVHRIELHVQSDWSCVLVERHSLEKTSIEPCPSCGLKRMGQRGGKFRIRQSCRPNVSHVVLRWRLQNVWTDRLRSLCRWRDLEKAPESCYWRWFIADGISPLGRTISGRS